MGKINKSWKTVERLDVKAFSGGFDFFNRLVIDPEKYRGRGRPRKTDYTTLQKIQQQLNRWITDIVGTPPNGGSNA